MAAHTPNENTLFCGHQEVLKLKNNEHRGKMQPRSQGLVGRRKTLGTRLGKMMIHGELAFTFLLRAIKAISNGFDAIPTFLCACLTTLSHDSCGEQP